MMGSFQTFPLIADKYDSEKRKCEAGSAKTAKKPKCSDPAKAVRIPDEESKKRHKAQRCVMCRKPKHAMCTNKDATPFDG